jgi:predicted AlkP superfamily pyrophosphatase or phosphodiesterase
MAEETITATDTDTDTDTAEVSKPAPKRKAAAKGKPGRKPGRKPAAKVAKKSTPDFAARAQEAGRNAFLASLGFYGMAFDQAQEQFSNIQEQLEERRQKADRLYQDLVKRGKQVEQDAKDAIGEIELPKFELDSLTDRKKLEAQLEKARARFSELKQNIGRKSAA